MRRQRQDPRPVEGSGAGLFDAEVVVIDAPPRRAVILVDERAETLIVSALAAARSFRPVGGD